MPEDAFQERVDDLLEALTGPEDEASAAGPPRAAAPALPGLVFDELTDDERLAVLRGLKLRTCEAGDVIVSEGEAAGGLFLLTAGAVRLYARDASGRNRPIGQLEEGDFFGEIASVAGLPRVATVVAVASGELLELDQATLDDMADRQPRAWAKMHAYAREQAARPRAWLDPDEADVAADAAPADRAFDPRLRLRVADAFLRAGHENEALRILVELCDELTAQGRHEKAVALLKKVEDIHERRARGGGPPRRGAARDAGRRPPGKRSVGTDDQLKDWLAGLSRSAARRRDEPRGRPVDADALAVVLPRLRGSRLFLGLDDDALDSFLRRLVLVDRAPGDVVLSEGECGHSVFVVAAGELKAFARQPAGRDAFVQSLGAGECVGEGAPSAQASTLTFTVARPSTLLEIGPGVLADLTHIQPSVRKAIAALAVERRAGPEPADLN
jgi:CRP-like cAMP-binding protein